MGFIPFEMTRYPILFCLAYRNSYLSVYNIYIYTVHFGESTSDSGFSTVSRGLSKSSQLFVIPIRDGEGNGELPTNNADEPWLEATCQLISL